MWHCVECLLKGVPLICGLLHHGQDRPDVVFDYSAATAAVVLLGPKIKLHTLLKVAASKNQSADDSVGRVHEFDCEVRRAGVERSE